MSNMSRRDFLMTAAATAAVISLPVLQSDAEDMAPPKHAGAKVDVGELSSFSKDGITDTWAKSDKLFVLRNDGKLFAVTSLCTHRGVQLISRGQDLYCTKHKSDFSMEGTVLAGPAKKSLARFAISVDDKKHVIVDTGKSFKEKEWDDPASFIDVKSA